MTDRTDYDADVIVVGAGPAGATLANLLGEYGAEVIVLEKADDVIDYPRAVGLDDEALRAFQVAGLANNLLKDMIQNTLLRYHHSNGSLFAEVGPKTKPYGWPRRNLFIQPMAEKVIRQGLLRYPNVTLLSGHEVVDFSQDESRVKVKSRFSGGEKSFTARFLVGADGGRSTIRKRLGIDLLGATHAWRWLVVDIQNDDRFEPYSAIYCHPKRPHIIIDLPYGYRRFEFRLQHEDTDEKMSRKEEVEKLLADKMPLGEKPDIVRSRIYTHHSRVAERFQDKRVFLVGDAAHLQPPFFGQGLNSGLRDVMNLAWKLRMVLNGAAGQELLDTYENERKRHAEVMVKFATGIGKFYAPYNSFTEMFRKAFFWAVQRLPGLRDYVLQMKFKPLPYYDKGGVVYFNGHGKDKVGRMFVQPRVRDSADCEMLLDDAVGKGFSVIGINEDPSNYMSDEHRRYLEMIGCSVVQVNRSRRGSIGWKTDEKTLVLDDVDGVFRDMLLANPGDVFVILRPDRYVFSVCDQYDLSEAIDSLRSQLGNGQVALENRYGACHCDKEEL